MDINLELDDRIINMYFEDFLDMFPDSFSYPIEEIEMVKTYMEEFGSEYMFTRFLDDERLVEIFNEAYGYDYSIIDFLDEHDVRNEK